MASAPTDTVLTESGRGSGPFVEAVSAAGRAAAQPGRECREQQHCLPACVSRGGPRVTTGFWKTVMALFSFLVPQIFVEELLYFSLVFQ